MNFFDKNKPPTELQIESFVSFKKLKKTSSMTNINLFKKIYHEKKIYLAEGALRCSALRWSTIGREL